MGGWLEGMSRTLARRKQECLINSSLVMWPVKINTQTLTGRSNQPYTHHPRRIDIGSLESTMHAICHFLLTRGVAIQTLLHGGHHCPREVRALRGVAGGPGSTAQQVLRAAA